MAVSYGQVWWNPIKNMCFSSVMWVRCIGHSVVEDSRYADLFGYMLLNCYGVIVCDLLSTALHCCTLFFPLFNQGFGAFQQVSILLLSLVFECSSSWCTPQFGLFCPFLRNHWVVYCLYRTYLNTPVIWFVFLFRLVSTWLPLQVGSFARCLCTGK